MNIQIDNFLPKSPNPIFFRIFMYPPSWMAPVVTPGGVSAGGGVSPDQGSGEAIGDQTGDSAWAVDISGG